VLLFIGAAGVEAALLAVISRGAPLPTSGWSSLTRLALASGAWLVAVLVVWRLPRRRALVLVLSAAVALRVAALAGPPTTSDDLYRYAWDGRVQAAGIDPYAEPPASPQLAGLRVAWLWPDSAACVQIGKAPGCTRINRPAVRTIYPPVAQAWFAAVYQVGGIGARHKALQVGGLIADLLTVGLMVGGLRRLRRDPRWVALYALSPLPALEFVNNAHVDVVGVMFIMAAMVVAAGPASPAGDSPVWRDMAVGLLLGAAALIKLYPAVLLVAVVGLSRARPWRSLARATGAAAALAVLAYGPHVAAVGVRVLGYLPGYLREEHYDHGERFLLLGAAGFSGWIADAAAVAALVAALAWVLWRRPPLPAGAGVLLVALFLTTTPVQPWYAGSLLAVVAIAAWPWPVAVVVAGYPYFFAVILNSPYRVGLGRVSYGAALVLLVSSSATRRRAIRKSSRQPEPPGPLLAVGTDVTSPAR
jgi:hypothetical protein